MVDEIEIPDCLTKPEAREWYVKRMKEHYRKVNEFYENYRDDYAPIGVFCDGGAMACALEEALHIEKPREIRKGKLEDIYQWCK